MDPYERTDWCEECGETYADCECDEHEHVFGAGDCADDGEVLASAGLGTDEDYLADAEAF